MTIDRSGEWWKGSEAHDLDQYLREYAAAGYAPDRFVHARCACGGEGFRLEADDTEGVARRTCARCGVQVVMLDGEEYLEEAELEECACPCGGEVFDVAVSFAHRGDGSVRWVAIGARCVACGVMGVHADWKIDYDPTEQLYALV